MAFGNGAGRAEIGVTAPACPGTMFRLGASKPVFPLGPLG